MQKIVELSFCRLLDIRENVLLDIRENVEWPRFLAYPVSHAYLSDNTAGEGVPFHATSPHNACGDRAW